MQNLSPPELIQTIFSPLIGAVASVGADELCQKNNLSFVEVLQPFSKITSEAVFRDAQGVGISLKGIRLNISDVDWRPPQTMLARKMLNDAVSGIQCENTKIIHLADGKGSLEIPLAEPWYEQWRETFLAVQFPADHEFTRHFLACLIVVSSSEPSPVDSAHQMVSRMHLQQAVTPPKLPKWFCADPLNCFVMLHDSCSGDVSNAQRSFEELKFNYGENLCFLIQINSHSGPAGEFPDPWLRHLRKQPKHDQPMDEANISSPRTPQDITRMPLTVQMSALGETTSNTSTPPSTDITIQHPLSPIQEQNSIISGQQGGMSTSQETLQMINHNVWAASDAAAQDIPEIIPHGMFLTPGDLENLKHFVQDLTIRALIPYLEKLVFVLNDAIANKKGVSRSLLTATKRWFGTNKPGGSAALPTQNAVVYTNESTELQTRKLGDLYFMFGHYNAAYHAYHQAKRDFSADSAWQYYAGALEMAALAAFMQGTASRKTFDYMEEAIVTYLSSCKLPQFATRATLLSVECLRVHKLYGEVAKQLIRMTSEDSDLRSGLFLEQASYAFLYSQAPFYRKYAFHAVLAGHRYAKAGQRKHAFRCYKQAYQVFKERGWSLAEDHIQYTIGKQALSLKQLTEASSALSHLLRPSSLQTPLQQGAFLREYIGTHQSLLSQVTESLQEESPLLNISLPRIVSADTKVLVTSQPPVAHLQMVAATNLTLESSQHEDWIWHKMEEMAVQMGSKKPVMLFRPMKSLFTSHTINPDGPIAIHGEPIEVSVTLENTIKIPIVFSNINLLWTFRRTDADTGVLQEEEVTNETVFTSSNSDDVRSAEARTRAEGIVWSTAIDQLTINEHECKTVTFRLTPKAIGQLTITAIVGQLASQTEKGSLLGKLQFDPIEIRPIGPHQPAQKRDYDKRLQIQVLEPAPALSVSFSEIPSEVLAGELIPITVQYSNYGVHDIDDVYLAFEHPRSFLLDNNNNEAELPLSVLKNFKDLCNANLSRDKEARKQYVCRLMDKAVAGDASLRPNETRQAKLWLQVPYKKGAITMRLLLYYSMPASFAKQLKYRLVRHSWTLDVIESIAMEVNCNRTNAETGELGLDVTIKNLNQVHHPISTEITLSDLHLFCPKFELGPRSEMVHLNSPGSQRIFQHDQFLLATELLHMRCGLREREATVSTESPDVFLASQLSRTLLKGPDSFRIGSVNSFLMKEETKYVRVFGPMTNSEEFNQIVSLPDKHMTLVLDWRANIRDSASIVQRQAQGQHFVQIRYLYESNFCPKNNEQTLSRSFGHDSAELSVYDFEEVAEKHGQTDMANDADWAVQNIIVSRRCFIEAADSVMGAGAPSSKEGSNNASSAVATTIPVQVN